MTVDRQEAYKKRRFYSSIKEYSELFIFTLRESNNGDASAERNRQSRANQVAGGHKKSKTSAPLRGDVAGRGQGI
jgi:hypothetical protein